MFSSFATQQAGLITDSLYLNLDAANYVNNLASPLNIGTILQDQYTGFANNTEVKSGSLAMVKTTPAYIDFVAANQTGSILLPDQNVTGRTFLVNSSWTIQWWGYWDVITGRDVCLFSQGDAANNNGLHIQARNSKLQFAMYNSDLTSTGNLTTGTWGHYACVLQNGTQFGNRKIIYFNGVQDSTGTYPAYAGGPAGRPFAIGTNIWAGTIGQGAAGYDGRIGEIQIYGRALNASEVFQNYQATRNKYNIFR